MPVINTQSVNEMYTKGILGLDIDKVREALDDGASPDLIINFDAHGSGGHALQYFFTLLSKNVSEENKQKVSDLVECVLEYEPDLLNKNYGGAAAKNLVDSLLFTAERRLLSQIVIHAIHQSMEQGGDVYQIDTKHSVGEPLSYRQASDDQKRIKMRRDYQTLETVRDFVAERLSKPESEIERELSANFGGQLDVWLHPLKEPDFEALLKSDQNKKEEKNPDSPMAILMNAAAMPPEEDKKKILEHDFNIQESPKVKPQEALASINKFVGMENVKNIARKTLLGNRFDVARQKKGHKPLTKTHHMSFEGNPGTGKTTMAREWSAFFQSLGVTDGKFLELGRKELVGAFIGHTEDKMKALFDQIDGGVLFIDEVHTLFSGENNEKDYGKQVVRALVTELENRRDNLVVIVAGYTEEVDQFIQSDPGMESRFAHRVLFEDYSNEQLGEILEQKLTENDLIMDQDAKKEAKERFYEIKKSTGARGFGNGRVVRSLVEEMPSQMAERMVSDDISDEDLENLDGDSLQRVTKEDIQSYFTMHKNHRPEKKEQNNASSEYQSTKVGFVLNESP